jgi:hypothetical protein
MAFNVILTAEAQFEIWDTVDWYEKQQPGLGNRFNNELNKTFVDIGLNLLFYSFNKKDFRKAILKHFPYLVIFKVSQHEIIVYTIIYGGRNPRLINQKIS